MGQDHIHLQVVARTGTCKERKDALRVLNVLQRGRHWVLVSLLLGNVITNETLPIVLDREVEGGWFAVLVSTLLIVVFGEIIPQSICAKYGLSVGAWSSRYITFSLWC
jgi:metal transporter CNNM